MDIVKNTVVVSLKGHDAGRAYVVAGVVNSDFVVLVDGKYRTLDNPKLKRIKHVRIVGTTDVLDKKALKDSDVIKTLRTIIL